MAKVRTAKDFGEGELTAKDMSVLREADSALKQHKQNQGVLRDLSLQHRVTVEWDLGIEAKRDRIFRLKVDEHEVLLDAEQMMRYLRWI